MLFCDIEGQFGDIEGQFDRIQWIAEHVEGYFILNLHFITRVYAYMLAVGGPSSLQHHSKSPRTTKLDLPDHQLQVILPYMLVELEVMEVQSLQSALRSSSNVGDVSGYYSIPEDVSEGLITLFHLKLTGTIE